MGISIFGYQHIGVYQHMGISIYGDQHQDHHGCAGCVADPHGKQRSWEHEAKKHLHKTKTKKKCILFIE